MFCVPCVKRIKQVTFLCHSITKTNRHDFFICTVFLCSEFKFKNIYSGVDFCGKNVYSIYYYCCYYYFIIIISFCRNPFLRIAGKNANVRTRKNFVPHGSLIMLLHNLTVRVVAMQQQPVNLQCSNDRKVTFRCPVSK